MKKNFFLEHPVFAIVISIVIFIIGGIGLLLLPVDQYPDIVPPVVRVTASYPGADATTVTQAVATPIEQELNGTPGMIYMSSTSSNSGGFSALVTFDIDTDPELAAVDIQNRIKKAEARLPAEVVQNGISVSKETASRLMTITILSDDPKFDEVYLSNYTTLNVIDPLRRIPGVGSVSSVGGRYYAMQIWVEPDKLADLGLTVKDIQNALKDQNRESAAGTLGMAPMNDVDITMPIIARGRLSSVKEFEDIVLRAGSNGSMIRLKDVARISLEAQSYATESGINGGNAAVININMLPGSNAMDVADAVKKEMGEIAKNFPAGIDYEIPFDMTTYIKESIHHVYRTFFEALLLVIVVVFLSLQNWRATLIPVVAVPISLVGTFGVMLMFGFSLNMLTLLGLILAIGIVVDDAIVVVENVDRIMNSEKLSPKEATAKAMQNLGSALVAMSLVLCAVFVPVSFLPGITGQLYRQFTVTIAVSVVISTIVALTLSPVMCAALLRPDSGKRKARAFRLINWWLARGNRFYSRTIRRTVNHPKRMYTAFGLALVFIYMMNALMPQSFMSQEDQGYFTVELELPEGATIERTRQVTERAMNKLMTDPDVEYVLNVTGSSPRVGSNQAHSQLTVILKDWGNRSSEGAIAKVRSRVHEALAEYPECKVYVFSPAIIPGLGTSGGFEMVLEARSDASYTDLQRAVDTLRLYANESKAIADLSTSMQTDIPQRCRPRPRQDAGHTRKRHILDHEGLYRLGVYQRLQYVQPHISRVSAGRCTIPLEPRQPQPILCKECRREHGAGIVAGYLVLHYRTGHNRTIQHVQFGHNIGRGRSRLQYRRGYGRIGEHSGGASAIEHRRGVERTVVPAAPRKRQYRPYTWSGVPVRIPVPGGTIRELGCAFGGDSVAAHSGCGRLSGHLGLRA